jgi:hypothetical protein
MANEINASRRRFLGASAMRIAAAPFSSAPAARIVNRFHARDLNLVMGPSQPRSRVRFRVTIDGQPPGSAYSVDADEGANGRDHDRGSLLQWHLALRDSA